MHVIAAKACPSPRRCGRSSSFTPARWSRTRGRWPIRSLRAATPSWRAGPTTTCCWSICAQGLTGKAAEAALGRAYITCNKNGVPFDPEKPMVTSGVRLGSPAGTTRGFGIAEFQRVGELIVEVLDGLAVNGEPATPRSKRRSSSAPAT
jgi:hypothetical protein